MCEYLCTAKYEAETEKFRAYLSLFDVYILVFTIFNHLQTHVPLQLVE